MGKQPVLFVGHGSPMNIVLDNEYTRSLRRKGNMLARPRAILVVSAHWLTRSSYVTSSKQPQTIYDFYGFPSELYQQKYPCSGSPEVAKLIEQTTGGIIQCDEERGIDHAAWAVLTHMYPKADIPVLELSLDYGKRSNYHYQVGQQLAPLRDDGILIIGSGNIVHNLRQIDFGNTDRPPYDWAVKFDAWVKENLEQRKQQQLCDYETVGKTAELSVPTNEHYLPLLYAAALRGQDDELSFFHEGFQNGSISMRCFQIG